MRRQQYGVAMPALLVLFGTGALGFALSRHKKVYLTLGGIVLIFAVLHGWACLSAGYNGWQNPIYDLTNYIRVVQIPLFTLCFITFLRETGEGGYQTVERGFVINFGLIVLVELVSTVTGTDPHTYANKQIGVLGWFATTNAQSAILCAIVPLLSCREYVRKRCAICLQVQSLGSVCCICLRRGFRIWRSLSRRRV